jgi:hypothetical protein
MTEIGYNTFLYSNEAEARQLLMWLIERSVKILLSSPRPPQG